MAKRVFFSFHYQDVVDFRANVVRNHWLLKEDREAAGFFDASIWEETKRTGEQALKNLIHTGLKNTSNTCVLVGSDTYKRPWVKYEIFKSIEVGNHLFAVHINSIRGKDERTKGLGNNPFQWLGLRISYDGTSATPIEYNGFSWYDYSKIDSINLNGVMPANYWGSAYSLDHWFKIYDWQLDSGYANFINWVK